VGARDVITIGHSLGGPVALEAALLMPDRIKGVVGIDTFLDGWVGLPQLIDRLRMNFADETRTAVRGMFSPTTSQVLVEATANAIASAPPDVAIAALEGVHRWAVERQSEAVAALSAPIGLVMARRPYTPKRFQGALKEGTLVGVEGVAEAGHFVMLEAPETFNAKLRDLLDRVRSRR
jgi:pimeloyl-ACP methyl ester carboxylesterase